MKKLIIFGLLGLFLSGCGMHVAKFGTGEAKSKPYVSSTYEALMNLPRPKQRTPVAVYKARDSSGQYKPSTTVSNFSTAVPQGITPVLMKVLNDSGWFLVVERESLSNLMTERKIISATRENFAKPDEKKKELPPLLFAFMNIEGGVVAYDSNIVTGGAGGRYTGIGGSTQYRQDQLTVSLRAVSVASGEVLNIVEAYKSILSREVQFGIFKFVSFKELLEVELGVSTNEPVSVCTKEAIEKAVFDLIVEGILAGDLELENPEDINSPIIQDYIRESGKARLPRDGQRQVSKK